NLISNAAKFTPDGDVELIISGAHVGKEFHLNIEVNDNGIGIAEEKQETIFEAFQQLSENRIANKGVGLGLPICKKIIESMGGAIDVASTEGLGSRFIVNVILPVVDVETEVIEKSVQVIHDKLRILVFEDDKISRLAVTALLNGHGHSVTVVENGKVGVELLKKENFDVILMDIHMPVMNGIEATYLIKDQKLSTAPVIGMTASVMNDEKESYFETGLDALVEKPINFEYLMEVINKKLS
ncbi:MAG: response regulator, partial [Gammaproteobacteria bacterium]|nr:response regulator [Gammaproteobacteria bacterium]